MSYKELLTFYYDEKIAFIEKQEWQKLLKSLTQDENQANKITKTISQSRQKTHPELVQQGHPAIFCKTLEELRKAMENFDVCQLKETSIHTVFSDGNPKSALMIIGEGPGAEEDAKGVPFVGQSGKLLDKMLSAVGINRNSCYITNIVPWRPPGNRNPSALEIQQCIPFVEKHIELISPKIILLLGSIATKALLKEDGISRLRGKSFSYAKKTLESKTQGGHNQQETCITVIPTFHPSYLLRSPRQKMYAYLDFLKIQELLK
jgi:DNA polymerase